MAALARGLVEPPVTVLTPAGPLEIIAEGAIHKENGSTIRLTGPAVIVAEGFFYRAKIKR